MRLNIGGTEPREGWTILNIEPGPNVDVVGACDDLSRFGNDSIAEIYASHVFEHLSHNRTMRAALTEAHRVLIPGGHFRISVPDFELLCRMFLHPAFSVHDRWKIMEMIYGGQLDAHDYHRVGLSWEFLSTILADTGFTEIRRVKEFGLFPDCSSIMFNGVLISLNVQARKRG